MEPITRHLTRPRILAVLPKMLPSAKIYTVRPLTHLASRGLVDFEYVFEHKANIEQMRDKDLLIFVRNNDFHYNDFLEEARALDIPCVYDLDDNFWEIPIDNPSGLYHRMPARMQQVENYLATVDLVRVYNPIVFEHVRRFNRRVFKATAGIDVHLAPERPLQGKDRKIRIIYATGRGARDELYQLILPDLMRILAEFDDRVELVLWRDCPEELSSFSNIRVLPIEEDYEKFLAGLAGAHYDIGLAPLTPSRFYLSKTNTKFRDYGVCRVAGVYSKVDVYSDIQDGVTGLLVDQSPGAWYQAMRRLIEDETLRKRIQESAYEYVCQHYNQEIMVQEWVQVLERLTGWKQRFDPHREKTAPRYALTLDFARRHNACVQIGGADQPTPGFQVLNSFSAIAEQGVNGPAVHLPLPDDSVDVLLCVESLETVQNIDTAIKEIYRVCKHGARVAVYARYGQNQANMGNPNIKQSLNEYSPRYWTQAPETNIYWKQYSDRSGEAWGLFGSGTAPYDIRCTRVEFFYLPGYLGLTAQEKRKSRQTLLNVCDYFLFHLVVVKRPVGEEEMVKLEEEMEYFEPAQATIRRFQEQVGALEAQIDLLQSSLLEKEGQLEAIKQQINSAEGSERVDYALLERMNLLQKSRLIKIVLRFVDKEDAWQSLSPVFDELKQYSESYRKAHNGQRLRLSKNMAGGHFLEYLVDVEKGQLEEAQFALVFDRQPRQGIVAIELVDPQQNIVTHSIVQASSVDARKAVSFPFTPPVKMAKGTYRFRLFSRDLDAKAWVYELQRYTLFGLGKLRANPFLKLHLREG